MDFFTRLERIRRRILAFSVAALVLLAAVLLVLVFNERLSAEGRLVFILLFAGTVLLLLGFIGLIAIEVSAYKRLLKDDLVKALLQDAFDELDCQKDRGLSETFIRESGMIMMGNCYEAKDYIAGKYKGISFVQSDVAIRQVAFLGKTASTVTFFDGRWMVFEFGRKFGFDLHIKEKEFSNAQSTEKNGRGMQLVSVDDEEFNRFFRVYSSDSQKTGYILTPRMREAILEVNYKLRGDLMLGFTGNRLHVALHGAKNAFEIPILGKPNREAVQKDVLADIAVITDFVDGVLMQSDLFAPAEE